MRIVLTAPLLLFIFAASAEAALTTHLTRLSFDAAAPGLLVEDFEAATVMDNQIEFVASGLDSTTSNATFSAGDILAGVEFRSSRHPDASGLFALGNNGTGPITTSRVIGQTYFNESFDLLFSPTVTAVGMDVFISGNSASVTTTASVFGASGLIGTHSLTTFDGTPTFFGFTADEAITRINLSAPGESEIIDNLAFGQVSAIPEPSTYALGVLVVGGIYLRRRRRT